LSLFSTGFERLFEFLILKTSPCLPLRITLSLLFDPGAYKL